jgi:predicted transposase YbfD/YdcC
VVTFDALHTVRANLTWLVKDKEAHYIAIVKRNQPLLHARVRALPWRQVPGGGCARERGHGRAESRTLKTACQPPGLPRRPPGHQDHRRRQQITAGKVSRETVYAVTSLTSAHATTQDLARLVREHWSIEAHHHIRDVTFGEDASTSRKAAGQPTWPRSAPPSSRPSKTPATCTSPKGGETIPLPPRPSACTASIRAETDIHRTAGALGGRPLALSPDMTYI